MKIKLLALFLFCSTAIFAQKAKVTSAYNYERYGELDKAKEAIDEAVQDPTTVSFWKAWLFRGNIYVSIARSQDEAYQNLHPDPVKVAYESYKKVYGLEDSKKLDMDDLNRRYKQIYPMAFNVGIEAYNAKDYGKARDYFQICEDVNSQFGVLDTLSMYNVALTSDLIASSKSIEDVKIGMGRNEVLMLLGNPSEINKTETEGNLSEQMIFDQGYVYVGNGKVDAKQTSEGTNKSKIYSSEEKSKSFEIAVEYYNKCIDNQYREDNTWVELASLYLKNNKEDEAKEVLKKARKAYPNSQPIITTELNIYLKNQEFDAALDNLNAAITNDPTNAIFYYARGTIYNEKGELDKAEADYLKSVEFDNENFDAFYNLGVLYYNNGADAINACNEIMDNKEYEACKAEANKIFEKATPYLERAYELNPEDQNTLVSLKQVYVRTGQTEKYQKLNK